MLDCNTLITEELFGKINDALSDRSDWEQRQRDWYRLRYEGYGRPTSPYPGAPDMHYPLVDIEIEKLKPFYIQQIYGQERLASFLNMNVGQNEALSTTNANIADDELRFDSEIRQNSNFDSAVHVVVDKMLHYGMCIVKKTWSKASDCIEFTPIDASHIIVPPWTASIKTTEWLVHIIRMSEFQYRANSKFTSTDEVIKLIKGTGQPGTDETRQQEIEIREGITGSKHDDSIILWEVYHKEPNDKEWTISTVSPLAGIDTVVCADFKMPFCRGSFPNELPFSEFTYEKATEGFYSPRGIAEILEPFEAALCKNWNYQLQFLDFNGQPTFFVNSPMANVMNFSNEPGSVRPFGIERDQPLDAPLDLMRQMEMTRALAEDRVQMPDLGSSQHLSGQAGQKGEVTATQIRAVVGLSAQSNDLRSRIFKGQLADNFRQSWDIICQYRKIEPHKALIVPCGNADQWNKEARVQKMIVKFQLLQGRPNVDQDELLKMLLEQDSPEEVKRLFRDTQAHTGDEQEKEADAITKMLIGYGPQIRGDEDAAIRLPTLAQFVEKRLQTGEPVTPEFARLALMRGMQFEQLLQKQKNPALQQLSQQFEPVVQILEQIAQESPTPPQGTPPGGTPSPTRGQQNKLSESLSIKLADLTPSERAQALAMAGIQADPSAPPPMDGSAAGAPQPQGQGQPQGQPPQPAGQSHNMPAITIQMPEQPPPVVDMSQFHIPAPIVHVPAPIVHVPAPIVNLPPHAPPMVHVEPPQVNVNHPPSAKTKTLSNIKRNAKGEIETADITEK